MKRTLFVLGITALFSAPQSLRAQSITPSVLNSSGGWGIVGDYDWEWSTGEVAAMSLYEKDKKMIITEGVLQNEQFTPVKATSPDMVKHLQVYPNPASTVVNIAFNSDEAGAVNLRLMDVTGKTLITRSGKVGGGRFLEGLDISSLAAATYMLSVTFNGVTSGEATTSYKIEKLN